MNRIWAECRMLKSQTFNSPTSTDMAPCFLTFLELGAFLSVSNRLPFLCLPHSCFFLEIKTQLPSSTQTKLHNPLQPSQGTDNFLVLECSSIVPSISKGCFLLCPWDLSQEWTEAALSLLLSPISLRHPASWPFPLRPRHAWGFVFCHPLYPCSVASWFGN